MYRTMQKASKLIHNADSLLITAGAGMGVDSGLPDFRGSAGFWKAYPALTEESLSFEDLANPVWFQHDPARAWGFYGHRHLLYKETIPHEGFQILKKWCNAKVTPSFVFTSNVDGHFQKAGLQADQVHECHGSINHLQCTVNCNQHIWPVKRLDIKINHETLKAEGNLPTCPNCGAIARPNILMFYDNYWVESRASQQQIQFEQWRKEVRGENIVIIEIGAGKAIPSVRNMSESVKGTLIRINPRDSDGPAQTLSLDMGALDALWLLDNFMY